MWTGLTRFQVGALVARPLQTRSAVVPLSCAVRTTQESRIATLERS